MINDLWSCADQSEQLLDHKCYMFVSNLTGSAYVCCAELTKGEKLKIMTLTSTQHTVALIFFRQRLMVGCFQAFDGIFPSGRKTSGPGPTPPPPIINLEFQP